MHGCDKHVDFGLVHTYVPLLVLASRALLLVALFRLVVHAGLDGPGLVVLLGGATYFDAYVFRGDTLNRAAGFLAPVAFFLYTSTHEVFRWQSDGADGLVRRAPCTASPLVMLYWAVDVLWASSSSMQVAALFLPVRAHVRIQTVACAWSLVLLAHVMLRCDAAPALPEVLLRVLLYYASCVCYFYTSVFTPDVDRNAHCFTVMHVCLHLLFVEPHVLLVSVLVSAGVYSKVYLEHFAPDYRSLLAPAPAHALRGPPHGAQARPEAAQDSLLSELRAAQAHVA